MEEKKRNRILFGVYILAFLMIGLLYGNSNNNPIPYLNRLFHERAGKMNTQFYWENFIVVIIMLILMFEIYNVTQWRFLWSFSVRLILVLVCCAAFDKVNPMVIKAYKHFQPGLQAIYLERDEMKLGVEDGKVTEGNLTVENCSNKEKTFYIEAVTYGGAEDEKRTVWVSPVRYTLGPGERADLHITSLQDKEELSQEAAINVAMYNSFEVRLWNEESEAWFISRETLF